MLLDNFIFPVQLWTLFVTFFVFGYYLLEVGHNE
jgi:hypothetical protein